MRVHNFSTREDGHGPIYRTIDSIAEHWSEISAFVSDPTSLAASAAAAVSIGATGAAGARLGLSAARVGWNALHGHPGEIVLGARRDKLVHYVTNPLVALRHEDARKGGGVFVGPSGQGKTTALETLAGWALLLGHTVVLFEADGDLGVRLLKRAKAMGLRNLYYFDPSTSESLRWNPMSGDPARVARQTVDTVASVARNHGFFADLNEDVTGHMTSLACAYAGHVGLPATVDLLLRLVADARGLESLLEVRRNEAGEAEVQAPFVRGELKVWLEQEFLSWSARMRIEYLVGLRNLFRKLLTEERVARALTPVEGEQPLDINRALNSGGLLVFRVAASDFGNVTSQALLTWGLQRLQQDTLGRQTPMRPVWTILDEAHIVLGQHSTAAADSYSRWFVQVRKYNVAPLLGYQSFHQLPDSLRRVLDASARNKFVFGGLHGEDALHAQKTLGHTTKRKEEVRELPSETLFGPKRVQKVYRTVEEPYFSLSEIENLSTGRCFFRGVRGTRQLPPVVTQLKQLPAAHKTRDRVPGAPLRRSGRGGGRRAG